MTEYTSPKKVFSRNAVTFPVRKSRRRKDVDHETASYVTASSYTDSVPALPLASSFLQSPIFSSRRDQS